ncbi:serine protease [bacterium]|nr:MAG: serine protease [bacterium]
MNKKQIVLVIIITAVIVWVADLLAGNYLSARLSTASWARKFNLFNPQAQLVVTNRETVRVNNGNDAVEAAENAKSKLSTLIYFENGKVTTTGSAINWTSDGYLVTTKAALAPGGKVFAIVTSNGDVFPVETSYPDPASNLVLLKTSAQGLAVLDPSNNDDLRVGQQVLGLQNSVGNRMTRFATGYISRLSSDTYGAVLESDLVSRSYSVQVNGGFAPATAIMNLSGRMVGVWDGQNVISVDDVRLLVNNFLNDQKQIVRPSFGFSYQMLSESESKILQTVSGARVMGLAAGKSAADSGIRVNDVIVEWGGKAVNNSINFDSILRQTKPNQTIRVKVYRSGTNLELNLVSGTM